MKVLWNRGDGGGSGGETPVNNPALQGASSLASLPPMFAPPAIVRCLLMACLAALLGGCYPMAPGTPEENHPLINEAMARKSGSPREAARLLERALEANPRLARAHWELGLICLNHTADYAAAIYHFQKVLALRPDWPHASTTRQLISNAKLELVKEGVEAPNLPSVQRQMDRLVAELHQLTAAKTNLEARVQYLSGVTQQLAVENLQLRQQMLAAHASAPGFADPAPAGASPAPAPPAGTPPPPRPDRAAAGSGRDFVASRPPSGPTPPGGISPSGTVYGQRPGVGPAPDASRPLPAGSGRVYTVRRGETAFALSRRYGFTVGDLAAANPGVDPTRLQAGQTIRLPIR